MSYPFATATATILRAIKAGKVSGTKDGSGQIETAELHGIYPRNGADTDAAVELGMAAPPLVPVERMPCARGAAPASSPGRRAATGNEGRAQ
jgi:hypothetical protein